MRRHTARHGYFPPQNNIPPSSYHEGDDVALSFKEVTGLYSPYEAKAFGGGGWRLANVFELYTLAKKGLLQHQDEAYVSMNTKFRPLLSHDKYANWGVIIEDGKPLIVPCRTEFKGYHVALVSTKSSRESGYPSGTDGNDILDEGAIASFLHSGQLPPFTPPIVIEDVEPVDEFEHPSKQDHINTPNSKHAHVLVVKHHTGGLEQEDALKEAPHGWRLPTVFELISILRASPKHGKYWSSSVLGVLGWCVEADKLKPIKRDPIIPMDVLYVKGGKFKHVQDVHNAEVRLFMNLGVLPKWHPPFDVAESGDSPARNVKRVKKRR